MRFFKNKKLTVKQLQKLDIADEKGIIDYQKYSKFKKEEQEKGYNVFLDVKGFSPDKNIEIIDNDSTIYNGKEHEQNNDIID
ncbi:TPA: hypothetical protein ACF9CH_002850 [Staphylococcus aureus]|nr:hypothetical protein [Staphylococcus aureus]